MASVMGISQRRDGYPSRSWGKADASLEQGGRLGVGLSFVGVGAGGSFGERCGAVGWDPCAGGGWDYKALDSCLSIGCGFLYVPV